VLREGILVIWTLVLVSRIRKKGGCTCE
jgi:hypothetical protein